MCCGAGYFRGFPGLKSETWGTHFVVRKVSSGPEGPFFCDHAFSGLKTTAPSISQVSKSRPGATGFVFSVDFFVGLKAHAPSETAVRRAKDGASIFVMGLHAWAGRPALLGLRWEGICGLTHLQLREMWGTRQGLKSPIHLMLFRPG